AAVADPPPAARVVVEPLQLQEDEAEPGRPGRNAHAGETLEGLREGERVRHALVAGDALGQFGRAGERERLEELLDALVDESQPRLEVHDLLALHPEAEGAGVRGPRG